jgi:hypothetical protein
MAAQSGVVDLDVVGEGGSFARWSDPFAAATAFLVVGGGDSSME